VAHKRDIVQGEGDAGVLRFGSSPDQIRGGVEHFRHPEHPELRRSQGRGGGVYRGGDHQREDQHRSEEKADGFYHLRGFRGDGGGGGLLRLLREESPHHPVRIHGTGQGTRFHQGGGESQGGGIRYLELKQSLSGAETAAAPAFILHRRQPGQHRLRAEGDPFQTPGKFRGDFARAGR